MKLHHHWFNIFLNRLGYLITLVLYLVYGESNFAKVVNKGMFAVGYKEFFVKKTSCAVSVYYPMDKATYNNASYKSKYWLNYRKGDKYIKWH